MLRELQETRKLESLLRKPQMRNVFRMKRTDSPLRLKKRKREGSKKPRKKLLTKLHFLPKRSKLKLPLKRLSLRLLRNKRLLLMPNLLNRRKRGSEDKKKRKKKKLDNLQRKWLLKLPPRRLERRPKKRD